MKRDMDLVRELLLKIEAADKDIGLSDLVSEEDEKNYDVAAYHMRMMIDEAGLVRGINASSTSGEDWLDLQLTWNGHEFLDTMRDPTIWEKAKSGAKKVGGASFDMLLTIGKEYVKSELKKRIGIDA